VLAGLKGDYSAHSLRLGFMTEAGRRNVEAMALTGHRSVKPRYDTFRRERWRNRRREIYWGTDCARGSDSTLRLSI
jgi:hypothetical protein